MGLGCNNDKDWRMGVIGSKDKRVREGFEKQRWIRWVKADWFFKLLTSVSPRAWPWFFPILIPISEHFELYMPYLCMMSLDLLLENASD